MIEQQDEPTIDDLRERVRMLVGGLLRQPLSPESDTESLADIDPGRYDSLGVLDCVAAVEEEFDVSIDLVDDDLRVTFRSVASIEALVRRRLADSVALGWGACDV